MGMSRFGPVAAPQVHDSVKLLVQIVKASLVRVSASHLDVSTHSLPLLLKREPETVCHLVRLMLEIVCAHTLCLSVIEGKG